MEEQKKRPVPEKLGDELLDEVTGGTEDYNAGYYRKKIGDAINNAASDMAQKTIDNGPHSFIAGGSSLAGTGDAVVTGLSADDLI